LSSEFQDESAPSLCAAVTKHLQESEQQKNSGNENWYNLLLHTLNCL